MAAELNKYNFIRWHDACDDIDPLSLPRFYVKDNAYSTPILKVGEATYFYLNFNVAVDYDFDVYLMKNNVKVGSALCTLTQLVIDTNVFEYYGNFTTPDVPDGFYRLGLYSGSDLLALSNVVEVIDNPTNTVCVKFRHVKDTYLFNYSLLPTDWYQQFRLRITEADKQVQDTHDQYRSVTTNKLRNYDAKVDRYVKFETYFFDAGMHEAMEVMIAHDVIYIQDKKFTFKEAYKRTVDASSKVSKGEFELWEDQFSQDQKFDNTDTKTLEVIYFNDEQSGTFRKNNCPPGYLGTEVEYVVPAGTYCSMTSLEAANQMATDDVAANGQTFANNYGTCILGTLIFSYTFENLDNLNISLYGVGAACVIDSNRLKASWPSGGGTDKHVTVIPYSGGSSITFGPGHYIMHLNLISIIGETGGGHLFIQVLTDGTPIPNHWLQGAGQKEFEFTIDGTIGIMDLLFDSGSEPTVNFECIIDDWNLYNLP